MKRSEAQYRAIRATKETMPQILTNLLGKLGSRKLWVTLLTMAAVLLGANQADGVDPTRVTTIVSAAIGGLYVLIQGLVDRAQAKAVTIAATTSPQVQESLKRLETLVLQLTREGVAKAKESQASSTGSGATLLVGLLMLAASPLVTGCMKNERPACSELTLAQLNAVYVKELVESCKGRTLDECTPADAIEIAHNKRLQEWVECR
jgi:hypothetical protein